MQKYEKGIFKHLGALHPNAGQNIQHTKGQFHKLVCPLRPTFVLFAQLLRSSLYKAYFFHNSFTRNAMI